MLSLERSDHLLVNGVEIFNNIALATLRQARFSCNTPTSGSKTEMLLAVV